MSQPVANTTKAPNKRIIIVFPTERSDKSTRYVGFGRRLQRFGVKDFKQYDILTVALENLVFVTDEAYGAHVIDAVSGIDLADAAFVYIKSWEAMVEEASALANYLWHKGVQFADTLPVRMGVSKLATQFRLWSQEVRMPYTIYVRRTDRLQEFLLNHELAQALGDKFIIKDMNGAKGKLNFYATRSEVPQILADNPTTHFICQRFIANNGDWRVGVYMNQIGFTIKRCRTDDTTHLNNTSAGAHADYYEAAAVPLSIRKIAKRAAVAAELQLSGVDVIEELGTNKLFILEVNQGSQVVTGAHIEQKILGFTRSLSDAIVDQYSRPRPQPMKVIGRRTIAKLSNLGITKITAKIDTGAYNSTLHAENIHLDGDTLHFDIIPTDAITTKSGQTEHITTQDFFTQRVRSSNGHTETRYSLRTRISIAGRAFSGIITLSDRSVMGFPFLIGRRLIRSRFLVNVELNEAGEQKWSY
jgi:glutathione synthase/RimK-type ligase-like ATP-grasp enzyme